MGLLVCIPSCLIPEVPDVSTEALTDVGVNYAVCGGQILAPGSNTVVAQGVCWSLAAYPTLNDYSTSDVSPNGFFTSILTGLTANTSYYARAYATNSAGTGYGAQLVFTTALTEGTPPDGFYTDPRDGHVYGHKLIGRNVWFTENLAFIPVVGPPDQPTGIWVYDYCGTDVVIAKATWNYKMYGCLYKWTIANTDYGNGRDVCPPGWHLPTDDEWKNLEIFLGMDTAEASLTGYRNTGNVGDQLKATTGWLMNGNGYNSSGMDAVPSGHNHYYGAFGHLHDYALYWTSTSYSSTQAYERFLHHGNSGVNRYITNKMTGKSIRCVKD